MNFPYYINLVYYNELGVKSDCGFEKIVEVYRKILKEIDRNKNPREFQRKKDAYRILTNPKLNPYRVLGIGKNANYREVVDAKKRRDRQYPKGPFPYESQIIMEAFRILTNPQERCLIDFFTLDKALWGLETWIMSHSNYTVREKRLREELIDEDSEFQELQIAYFHYLVAMHLLLNKNNKEGLKYGKKAYSTWSRLLNDKRFFQEITNKLVSNNRFSEKDFKRYNFNEIYTGFDKTLKEIGLTLYDWGAQNFKQKRIPQDVLLAAWEMAHLFAPQEISKPPEPAPEEIIGEKLKKGDIKEAYDLALKLINKYPYDETLRKRLAVAFNNKGIEIMNGPFTKPAYQRAKLCIEVAYEFDPYDSTIKANFEAVAHWPLDWSLRIIEGKITKGQSLSPGDLKGVDEYLKENFNDKKVRKEVAIIYHRVGVEIANRTKDWKNALAILIKAYKTIKGIDRQLQEIIRKDILTVELNLIDPQLEKAKKLIDAKKTADAMEILGPLFEEYGYHEPVRILYGYLEYILGLEAFEIFRQTLEKEPWRIETERNRWKLFSEAMTGCFYEAHQLLPKDENIKRDYNSCKDLHVKIFGPFQEWSWKITIPSPKWEISKPLSRKEPIPKKERKKVSATRKKKNNMGSRTGKRKTLLSFFGKILKIIILIPIYPIAWLHHPYYLIFGVLFFDIPCTNYLGAAFHLGIGYKIIFVVLIAAFWILMNMIIIKKKRNLIKGLVWVFLILSIYIGIFSLTREFDERAVVERWVKNERWGGTDKIRRSIFGEYFTIKPNKIAIVKTEQAQVKNIKSTMGGEVVYTAKKKQVFPVLSKKEKGVFQEEGSWYKILIPNGSSGWISSKNVKIKSKKEVIWYGKIAPKGSNKSKVQSAISQKSISHLVQNLKNSDENIRKKAAESLDKLGWKPKDDTKNACYLIAKQEWNELKKLKNSAIVPLIQALKFKNGNFRNNVESTLVEIGEPAIEPLIEVLADDNWHVRLSAIRILEKIGDRRAIGPLKIMLNDRHENVAKAAKEALRRLK